MQVKVKKFSNRGLYVYVPKKLGYIEGDLLELLEKKLKTKVATVEYVDNAVDALRGELTSRRF